MFVHILAESIVVRLTQIDGYSCSLTASLAAFADFSTASYGLMVVGEDRVREHHGYPPHYRLN